MEPNRQLAEQALKKASESNPGPWEAHSRYVAEACQNIAAHCKHLSADKAYVLGLLHDIGRYAGVSSEKHLIDGYRYCMERGWEKAAQICISHAFMIQDINTSIGKFDVGDDDYLFMKEFVANAVYDDYDRLVQLCDALAMPTGFCLLEKRFVDVTIRYGIHPATVDRWKKILEIKQLFEKKIGCSIYTLLPGVEESSFRQELL
ncbi:HD domain-containing protein [Lachnospiraceae bacterium 46-15]